MTFLHIISFLHQALIGHLQQLAKRLVDGNRWDIVFNICEGMHGWGREAQVPALLDAYQIPYVFSDPLVCALTLHKGMTKDVVRAAGVATPDFAVISELGQLKNVRLPYPLFAKPVAEGTGKGVTVESKINNAAELKSVCRRLLAEHKQPVLVERFLPGRRSEARPLGGIDQQPPESPWRKWAEELARVRAAYEAAVQRSSVHSEKMNGWM